ncbi:MAG: InlB B-repeat-containing protein [Agathobacter sp.]|nr:InlB B-repeat-containing protein [Agathobacter sp.]
MEKKKWIIFLLFLFISVCSVIVSKENYQAATSYTNAKEFYESTALKGEPYHSESWDGAVYYATYAKLASSSTNLKFATVGFDITLSGNGHSVSFAVERFGDSITMVDQVNAGGYQYDLYAVEDKELYRLAQAVDPNNATYVLDASLIHVQIDAIMVTKQGESPNGGITENGYGGISKWGTIYRLKNDSDLNALKSIFWGHYFESYKKIESKLDNPKLDIMYNIGAGAKPQTAGYSSGSITQNGTVLSDMLFKSGVVEKKSFRVLQQATLADTGKNGIDLFRTGYHLEPGKEWKKSDGTTFASGGKYMPRAILPAVGLGNRGIVLYANWKPNTYTIEYDANGGSGRMNTVTHTYDKEQALAKNTFTRTGYTFMGWARTPDGAVDFTDGQTVENLTSANGGKVTLYAVWQKNVYEISLDDDGADTPGSGIMYEGYEKGFYSDEDATSSITGVTKPQKTGYTFGGYFDAKNGGGVSHIDGNGTITASSTTFKQDRTIYAKWTANTYTIRYHVGIPDAGLADTPATYDKDALLRPNVYTRRGYTFMGWARTEGGAVVYADKAAVKNITSVNGAVIDLYAVWEPVTAQITLNPQEGSGGTGYFYEKYGVNFYTNNMFTAILDRISIPARTGYDFKGYFADMFGSGTPLIDTNGSFGFDSTYFVQDSTLFAKWLAKTYPLILNKEGGTGGTDSVTATYDRLVPGAEAEVVPRIQAPTRYGFEFKGYYTGKNGTGTRFYNEFMYSDIVYKSTTGTQLYAYWVDNYAPDVSLSGNDKWTNQQTTLTASASDDGVGLKSLTIYRIGEDGSLTAVATASNLNGAKSKELAFTNTSQGVTRYKAVAVDLNGNTAESYSTVYYDITKPTGTVVQFTQSGNSFTIIVDVTDANISN